MLSIHNLFRDLAGTPHGDHANYGESVLSSLSRDVFGGNSLALGIFCLRYGDQIGSTRTMRALKQCQSIMNFPVQNDARVLGLLRKFRLEIQGL